MTKYRPAADIPRLEYAAWGFVLCLAFDAFVYMTSSADGFSASGEGRWWISPLLTACFLASFGYVLLINKFRLSRVGLTDWLLIGVPVLCLASAAWSVAPADTIKRSAQYTSLTLFVLAMYWRQGFAGSIRLVGRVLAFLAIASLVSVVVLPDLAVSYENHEGAWKGVFGHKNTLGALSGFGLVSQFAIAVLERKWRVERTLSAVVLAATLVSSRSVTAMVSAGVALASGIAWWRIHRRWARHSPLLLVGGIALALCAASMLPEVVSLEVLAAAFEKDVSATGRIPLWDVLWHDVQREAMLGYGYGAYWAGQERSVATVLRAVGFSVSHAHNGYLELILAFGVGISLLLLFAIGVRLFRFVSSAQTEPAVAAVGVAITSFLLIFSLTETAILSPTGGVWLCFLIMWLRSENRSMHSANVSIGCRAASNPSSHAWHP